MAEGGTAVAGRSLGLNPYRDSIPVVGLPLWGKNT